MGAVGVLQRLAREETTVVLAERRQLAARERLRTRGFVCDYVVEVDLRAERPGHLGGDGEALVTAGARPRDQLVPDRELAFPVEAVLQTHLTRVCNLHCTGVDERPTVQPGLVEVGDDGRLVGTV